MKINYCLGCGLPLDKINDSHYVCPAGHDYWNNPKGTADVAIINEAGQILVSRRAREPNKGGYDLPGGFLEYGESAVDAAIREIKEETGLIVEAVALELIFTCGGFYLENESLLTAVFMVRKWEGEPVAADDSESLEWQPLDFLDSEVMTSAYVGLRAVIESKL